MSKLKRVEHGLLFLTVLFLPTQLGKHFWPQFSFIYSLPLDYLSPTIYFWDLLVVALISVHLANKAYINKLALNLFFIFILSQAVSLLGADQIKAAQGLVRLEQFFISGLFGVYLASINLNKTKAVIFLSLSLAILGESALAILQFIKEGTLNLWILGERTFSLSTPAIAKFDFYGNQFLRPYATFPHPNVLAGFMVVCLPLLPLLKIKSNRFYINFCVFLAGIATMLTVSRSALIVGFCESLLLFRRKYLFWLIALLILMAPFLYTRFSTLFSFDNLSLVRREELTEVAWQTFLSHPILGVGLNNFIPKVSEHLLAGPSRFLQPVHNIFLLELSETGLVGFLGFLALIIFPIKKIWGNKTLMMVWGTILFLGLLDHYFLTLPQGYRLLFLIWGFSFMLESNGGKSSKNI